MVRVNDSGVLNALMDEAVNGRTVDGGLLLPTLQVIEDCLDKYLGQSPATENFVDLCVEQHSPPTDDAVRHRARLRAIHIEQVLTIFLVVNDLNTLRAVSEQDLGHDSTSSHGPHMPIRAIAGRPYRPHRANGSSESTMILKAEVSQPGVTTS
jgi:hypothetical protein